MKYFVLCPLWVERRHTGIMLALWDQTTRIVQIDLLARFSVIRRLHWSTLDWCVIRGGNTSVVTGLVIGGIDLVLWQFVREFDHLWVTNQCLWRVLPGWTTVIVIADNLCGDLPPFLCLIDLGCPLSWTRIDLSVWIHTHTDRRN